MKCRICGKSIKENTEGNSKYCQGHSVLNLSAQKPVEDNNGIELEVGDKVMPIDYLTVAPSENEKLSPDDVLEIDRISKDGELYFKGIADYRGSWDPNMFYKVLSKGG